VLSLSVTCLEEKTLKYWWLGLMIIVSGIRSIICIRLRPRSLMSSDS